MFMFTMLSLFISCTESIAEKDPDAFVYTGPHSSMFEKVKRLADRDDLYQTGEWKSHFGDGALFGPSFDLQFGQLSGEEHHTERGLAALEFNRQTVESVNGNLLQNVDELEIISMSLLSLMRAGELSADHDHSHHLAAGEELLSSMDTIVLALGDYMEHECSRVISF